MKFLIDENLTPELADLFKQEGVAAHHVNELKGSKKQRIIDDQLRRLTLNNDFVIVTKDDDFVKSFVDRKVPEKLVYIFGLDRKQELLDHIKPIVQLLPKLIAEHDFIEINAKEIRFPFAD